jgi:hypothetical protein
MEADDEALVFGTTPFCFRAVRDEPTVGIALSVAASQIF